MLSIQANCRRQPRAVASSRSSGVRLGLGRVFAQDGLRRLTAGDSPSSALSADDYLRSDAVCLRVGVSQLPEYWRGTSSRRIMIVRFRPANIRVINRRDSRLDRLRCCFQHGSNITLT